MVVVSYSGREINAKLVYYGTGLSGKTTNLEFIYGAIPSTSRGKMVSMKTQNDRTLFFDLLPVDLGEISGFKTRFMLYTVPGQVFYNATRKLVLRGADAIVFVADSERGRMQENKDSLQNLVDNLNEYNLSLDNLPWVIQYNKRDLPDVYTVEELNRELNPKGVPWFEAVAVRGDGVFETFRGVSRLLLENLNKELKLGSRGGSVMSAVTPGEARPAQPAPTPVAPVAAVPEVVTPAAIQPPVAEPAPAQPAFALREPAPMAEPEPRELPQPEPAMACAEGAEYGSVQLSQPSMTAPAGVPERSEPAAVSTGLSELQAYQAAPPMAGGLRRQPSLAERFTSWLKSSKPAQGEVPVEPGAQSFGPSAPAPASPYTSGYQESQDAMDPESYLLTPVPQSELAPVASAPAEAPREAETSAPVAVAVETVETVEPPATPVESQASGDDQPLALPDFSVGFTGGSLPESIPAGGAAVGRAPARVLAAAETQPAERRMTVPVTLHGLKPGQKVRIHLVLEVEAVDEGS